MNISDAAARYAPYVLSIVRIVAALLFFEHGTSRLFGWPSPMPAPALEPTSANANTARRAEYTVERTGVTGADR